MAKKVRCKIDWHGNGGRCYPAPGTVKTANCGVCGMQMKVQRNVVGCTSWAESMARETHKHDRFTCPNINKSWHRRIYELKVDVYLAEIHNTSNKNEIKKVAEKEIIKLLEANAVR